MSKFSHTSPYGMDHTDFFIDVYVGDLQTDYLHYKSHQHVTNIMILPPISSNCRHHKVTNIAYNITVAQYMATGSKICFSTIEQQLYLDHW